MAFFGKVKNFFGGSTVKVDIAMVDSFTREQGRLEGRIRIVGQSDQVVKEVSLEFIKVSVSTTEENPLETETTISSQKVCSTPFSIAANEERIFDFSLPFVMPPSVYDRMIAGGNSVLGTLGRLGNFTSSDVNVTYKVVAVADVQSAALDPRCSKTLTRVG